MDLFTDPRIGGSIPVHDQAGHRRATVVTNVISLILALGLNSKIKGKTFLRAAYFRTERTRSAGSRLYLPVLSSPTSFRDLGDALGIDALQRKHALQQQSTAWIAIVIVCAWQSIAMNTIIYISGLQTVPEDVYEAGDLDGATGWKKFRHTLHSR